MITKKNRDGILNNNMPIHQLDFVAHGLAIIGEQILVIKHKSFFR